MASKTKKIFTFTWAGLDKSGNSSKGKIQAASLAEAKALLRRQGVAPRKVSKESSFSLFSARGQSIKPVDIAFFTRQVATMLKAGVPLIQGLEIVATGVEKDKLKKLILDIRDSVNSGQDLASSMARHPLYFDDLYCSLVAAGEQSGALETMLDRIATYKEKLESLKAKIKKALTYPIAVLCVGLLVSVLLLLKVVPQFQDIFSNFGADLPGFTLMILAMSDFVQEWWMIIAAGMVIFFYLFIHFKRTSVKFANWLDKVVLKIPVLGDILRKAVIARFARTLSTTFAAGVPLVEALESAAGASGNVIYRDAIIQIRNAVSTGQTLQNSMQMTGVFPNMVVQMIAIGEEAGSLDSMLDKVAAFYEEEVDNAVDNMSSLMEPFIMVVLGTIVGGLVVAMYLPIFKLGAVV
ncbi:MAG: type II secretion system F family protein [Pseudomonadales bacterium]|nr:type II secretion system F family protein [Pseudomonadales bacterium]NRA16354.1 type II secretion system F family protein [Oceanospirillaceae bacterium]